MGLETGNWIQDFVDTWPTGSDDVNQGDDHIRLIKAILQNQFPSLGAAAVNRTAAELNAVTAKLVSFNGRTATAAVPTDDVDYSATGEGDGAGIAKLADFDTGWSSGDYAVWDGAKFAPVVPIFSESFESAELSLTAGNDNQTVAHGLSSTPKLVQAILRCKIAQFGYSVDDEYVFLGFANNIGGLASDSANVYYMQDNTPQVMNSRSSTTFSSNITPANWRLVIRAWA